LTRVTGDSDALKAARAAKVAVVERIERRMIWCEVVRMWEGGRRRKNEWERRCCRTGSITNNGRNTGSRTGDGLSQVGASMGQEEWQRGAEERFVNHEVSIRSPFLALLPLT
jgi:hypothetical protein